MRVTVGNLARSFHSLDVLDDTAAQARLRLAMAQGHDAPLVACSTSLFTLAGALFSLPRLEEVGASLAMLAAITTGSGLIASLAGLAVRDWLLGRALARPERLRRCLCCAQDLTGVPELGDRSGDVRCPECGRVSHLADAPRA